MPLSVSNAYMLIFYCCIYGMPTSTINLYLSYPVPVSQDYSKDTPPRQSLKRQGSTGIPSSRLQPETTPQEKPSVEIENALHLNPRSPKKLSL